MSHLGLPIRWNGLGTHIGEHGEHYGGLLTGMVDGTPGWVVLIASIAAAGALLGAALAVARAKSVVGNAD